VDPFTEIFLAPVFAPGVVIVSQESYSGSFRALWIADQIAERSFPNAPKQDACNRHRPAILFQYTAADLSISDSCGSSTSLDFRIAPPAFRRKK
jgi:hypothetical protein